MVHSAPHTYAYSIGWASVCCVTHYSGLIVSAPRAHCSLVYILDPPYTNVLSIVDPVWAAYNLPHATTFTSTIRISTNTYKTEACVLSKQLPNPSTKSYLQTVLRLHIYIYPNFNKPPLMPGIGPKACDAASSQASRVQR